MMLRDSKIRELLHSTYFGALDSRSHAGAESGCSLPGFCGAWAISTECFIFCHSAEARQCCWNFSSISRHSVTQLFPL